jgi:ribosomal protein S18 acetylase RimI-like enzyme
MGKRITVREFRESEIGTYRSLRLEALRESPHAFGGTHELESTRDDWGLRLAESVHDKLVRLLIAEADSEHAGLAMGKVWPETPSLAHVYQMWVEPRFRRLRVGHLLLQDLVVWAEALGVQALVLGVTRGDSPARRLYERAGFLPVGEPTPLKPDSTLLVQDMRLNFRRS